MLPDGSGTAQVTQSGPDFYLVCLDESSAERALRAARALRAFGKVDVDPSMRALKTQLRQAEKRGARVTVIVESVSPRHVKWKDMSKREQFDVEDERLLEFAKKDFNDQAGR